MNSHRVHATVDTGASHIFVAERLASRLGLSMSPAQDQVKTINAEKRQIAGISYNVLIVFGDSKGKYHVRIVQLDDYDVIAGLDLLRWMRAAVIPHLGSMQVMDKRY